MKTLKNFLENCSDPTLAKVTLKAGGLSFKEIKNYMWDCYDANTGTVRGMIYYSDTVKFAKKHHILQALDVFENEYGKPTNKPNTTNETQYFNWLAWFAWENTLRELLSYLEE